MTVRRYRSVLIVIAVLIAWGSLYPFHFTDSPDFRGFFGWPGLSDILLNLFLYVPIGFLAFHSLASGGTSNRLALGAAIGFGLSTAMEVLQAFDPPRDSSLSDILCNGTGALGGALVAAAWRRHFSHGHTYSLRAAARRPAFLLVFWALFQLYPVLPLFHLRVIERSWNFAASQKSWFETLLFGADWLTALLLIRELLPKNAAIAVPWFACIAPVKLALYGRRASISELAGALIAAVLFMPLSGWHLLRSRILPTLLVVLVVLRELWPLRFAAATSFSWIPFAASLDGSPEGSLIVLARKTFVYGSAIWAVDESTRHTWPLTLAGAVLLFGLEWLQRWMPGRTPDITDALLVILAGAGLALLRHHRKQPALA